jgi:hypothetical protein
MPVFAVQVIKQYKQFEGIMDKGDTVLFTPTLSTEPKVLCNEWRKLKVWNNPKEGYDIIAPMVIAPSGSFEGYTIITKNGDVLSDTSIRNQIGFVSAKELFKRV